MKTTIHTTASAMTIRTEGPNLVSMSNTLYRPDDIPMWGWHEMVANEIANHHASAMGAEFPCPEPVMSTQQETPEWVAPDSPIPHCPECGSTAHSEHPGDDSQCNDNGEEIPQKSGSPRTGENSLFPDTYKESSEASLTDRQAPEPDWLPTPEEIDALEPASEGPAAPGLA